MPKKSRKSPKGYIDISQEIYSWEDGVVAQGDVYGVDDMKIREYKKVLKKDYKVRGVKIEVKFYDDDVPYKDTDLLSDYSDEGYHYAITIGKKPFSPSPKKAKSPKKSTKKVKSPKKVKACDDILRLLKDIPEKDLLACGIKIVPKSVKSPGRSISRISLRSVKSPGRMTSPNRKSAKPAKPEKAEKECPEGQVRNPKTGRCIKDCPPGTIRNEKTGRCIKQRKSPKRKSKRRS